MAWGPFLQAHYEVLASREKTPAGYPVVFFLVALPRAGAFFLDEPNPAAPRRDEPA
jgi:hypothetical protein